MSESYINYPEKQTEIYESKYVILFSAKRQGTYIRAGAFHRINMVLMQSSADELAPVLTKIYETSLDTDTSSN